MENGLKGWASNCFLIISILFMVNTLDGIVGNGKIVKVLLASLDTRVG